MGWGEVDIGKIRDVATWLSENRFGLSSLQTSANGTLKKHGDTLLLNAML